MSSTAEAVTEEIEVDTAVADPAKAVQRQRADEPRHKQIAKDIDRRVTSLVRKSEERMSRQFNQDKADLEARLQREMRELRDENQALKSRTETATGDAAHDAEIAKLTEQLEAALEAGDSKKAAQLQTLIARKEAQYIASKTGIKQSERVSERKTEQEPAEKPKQKGSARAQEFIEATEWWDDPKFVAERGAANAIHAQLVAEGSDPESDAHYKRINKRLKAKFPTLKLTDPDELGFTPVDSFVDDEDDEDEIEPQPRGRAPVQNFVDRGSSNQNQRQRGVKLTPQDIEMIRSMKLDPNNDAVVAQYAKSKAERIAQNAARVRR